MLKLSECNRQNLCVDCDNTKCLHHGKMIADCPRYRCDRPKEFQYDCEHCEFIDGFIEDMRKGGGDSE